jgi:two-component system response regulator AtoC
MPRLSGRDLLSHIQTKHPMTPVIVISAMFEEDDAREIIDAGAFAYFAKPFNLAEIEAAVDRAILRRQELAAGDAVKDKGTLKMSPRK